LAASPVHGALPLWAGQKGLVLTPNSWVTGATGYSALCAAEAASAAGLAWLAVPCPVAAIEAPPLIATATSAAALTAIAADPASLICGRLMADLNVRSFAMAIRAARGSLLSLTKMDALAGCPVYPVRL
jgi:hypothetical protein